MLPPNEKQTEEAPRRYLWPWIVWPMALLFILMAVFWVWVAAKKIKSQRESATPPPTEETAR